NGAVRELEGTAAAVRERLPETHLKLAERLISALLSCRYSGSAPRSPGFLSPGRTQPQRRADSGATPLTSLLLAALAWAAYVPDSAAAEAQDESFLWTAAPGRVDSTRFLREAYIPKEGDLLFFTDHSPFWRVLYLLAYTAPPYHVGIVVRLHDGR